MYLPVNSEIDCSDGPGGCIICLMINPLSLQVTHLVVAEQDLSSMKRLVPVQLLKDNTSGHLSLACTRSQLAILRPFLEVEYTSDDALYFAYEDYRNKIWPYHTAETMPVPWHLEEIPANAVTIHRDAPVKVRDKRVGQVVGFLIQAPDGPMTHLVLRRGQLWRKKQVTVPVSEIERIEKDVVYLRLAQRSLEALPEVSVSGKDL